jgi:hypothetical protein
LIKAKATKIVKHATPVKEKPKDPAQVFREQLAKAAYERDHRAKSGPSIDELLKATQYHAVLNYLDDALLHFGRYY